MWVSRGSLVGECIQGRHGVVCTGGVGLEWYLGPEAGGWGEGSLAKRVVLGYPLSNPLRGYYGYFYNEHFLATIYCGLSDSQDCMNRK